MGKSEFLHTCDSISEWMEANDDHALLIFMKFFYKTILFYHVNNESVDFMIIVNYSLLYYILII